MWIADIPVRIFSGMDVNATLRGIMQARGWNQDELSDRLGTTQATVSRWLAGAEPKGRNMERIRELALESGVIERARVASNRAPLMGRVGAGAEIDVEFEQAPADGYDTVELPFAFPDPIVAFEVEGDSMLPAYEPGEVIVCLRDQVRSTDHYIGQRVVVRTSTGERYIKRLARGRSRGTYDLESWNARTIEDVRVEWVGEIVASVNPAMVRRVEQSHRRAKYVGKTPKRGASKDVVGDKEK
jgi:repressor LexA